MNAPRTKRFGGVHQHRARPPKPPVTVERWVPTGGNGLNEKGGLVPVIGSPANLAEATALAKAAGAGVYRIDCGDGGVYWRRIEAGGEVL